MYCHRRQLRNSRALQVSGVGHEQLLEINSYTARRSQAQSQESIDDFPGASMYAQHGGSSSSFSTESESLQPPSTQPPLRTYSRMQRQSSQRHHVESSTARAEATNQDSSDIERPQPPYTQRPQDVYSRTQQQSSQRQHVGSSRAPAEAASSDSDSESPQPPYTQRRTHQQSSQRHQVGSLTAPGEAMNRQQGAYENQHFSVASSRATPHVFTFSPRGSGRSRSSRGRR